MNITSEYIERGAWLEKAKELAGGSFSTPLIISAIENAPKADVFEVEPFKEKAQFAIEVTDSKDTYSTGLRNGIRYCIALIDGKEPEYEQCQESDEIKKALEKQIPQKPVKKNPICYNKTKDGQEYYAYDYHCPVCDKKLKLQEHHCPCGQALDWSDTE